ncbi:MAG: FG-GAP-like repeat-containing protein [Blastocatellia bacterium]
MIKNSPIKKKLSITHKNKILLSVISLIIFLVILVPFLTFRSVSSHTTRLEDIGPLALVSCSNISFLPRVTFATGTSPISIAAADLDGDGKADLAVANQGSNTASVLRNTSTVGTIDANSFAPQVTFAAGTGPFSVAIGDLDGDSKLDLVVANVSSATVSVLRNTSTIGIIDADSFAAQVTFPSGTSPVAIAIGDIDADGKMDLAIANQTGTVSVLRNTSTMGIIDADSFAAPVSIATGANPRSVAIGDLDGDGKADLAVANQSNDTVSLLRNISTPGTITTASFDPKVDLTTGSVPFSVAIGDLDGDGKADLANSTLVSGTVEVRRNTSTVGVIDANSFAAPVPFLLGGNPGAVAMGDFNGDNKLDLTITNLNNAALSVLRNTSVIGTIDATSFVSAGFLSTGGGPFIAAIEDLDGDDRLDIAVCANSNNVASVLRNNCLAIPTQAPTTTMVSSTANPSVFGQSITITATVAPMPPATGTPTGLVVFNIDGIDQTPITLSGGQASFPISSFSTGNHTIFATYSGNSDFLASTSAIFTQTVNQATTSTILSSSLNPSTLGQNVTFTATVTVNSPGVGTPSGLVNFFDGSTMIGSGTLSAGVATFSTSTLSLGTHPITAQYLGDINFTDSTSATLNQMVNCPIITISPTTLPNSQVNTTYNQTLTASGGTAPYTFSVISGSLPTGLSLSPSGVLSGTPTVTNIFNFTVQVSDANNCLATRNYVISISCAAINITPVSLPNVIVNTAYPTQTLVANGGIAPYNFAVSSGTLPTGLTLTATGVLSGTPTSTGTFTFTVTATDTNTCIGTIIYTIVVNCPNIIISPATIPNGQINSFYSQVFNASGGIAPYTFALTNGALPSGLNFIAAQKGIAGTPLASGTFNFTITTTDAIGCAVSRNYTLTVAASAGSLGFSVSAVSVTEGGRVTLSVNRTNGNTGAVSVNYSTSNSSAIAGRDFISKSGTLTFANNDTSPKSFTIETIANSSFEPNKTFSVQLSGATSGTTISVPRVAVTITEKDTAQPGQIAFEQGSYSISEKGGVARITVARSNGNNVAVAVNYSTSAGANASSGINYFDASGTLNFGVGVNSQSFTIPIIDDKKPGGDKVVNLRLSGTTNGASLVLATATLTIVEASDPPPPPLVPPAKLQADSSVDFGKVNLGSTLTRNIRLTNIGGENLTITNVSILGDSLSISSAPNTLLKANESTSIAVTFKPSVLSRTTGNVTVTSNGGNANIALVAESVDLEMPRVSFSNPSGGQIFDAGNPVVISFQASDNDDLSGFTISVVGSLLSRGTFNNDIGRLDGKSRNLVWNIPITLESPGAKIVMTATDRSGNITTTTSGIFSIRKAVSANPNPVIETRLSFTPPPQGVIAPPGNLVAEAKESDFQISNKLPDPALLVEISFQAPPVGQVLPPQNVRVRAKELDSKSIANVGKVLKGVVKAEQELNIAGYNVYRVPQPVDGTLPKVEDLIKDENLVTTLPPDATGFMDKPSTGQSDNFAYSVTSFFGNGQMSNGSDPMGTNLPVIKNPMFAKGTVFLDAASSFIKNGAKLIINDEESYTLGFDDEATRFTVPKKQASTESGLVIKKVVTKKDIVKLVVKNPEGSLSVAVRFNRKGVVDTIDNKTIPVNKTERKIEPKADDDTTIAGFNIYRVAQPADGTTPKIEDIIKPENLIGSVSGNENTFMDNAPTSSSSSGNFTYSATSFFGNGMMSSGSDPASTDLPVIKNPVFEDKTIFLEAASSFIKLGAVLIIDDTETFVLSFDENATRFTPGKSKGSSSNQTIDMFLKKNVPVRLTVKNPDGKISVGVMFTKNKPMDGK